MTTDDYYGEAFRDAYALLHGGRPGEAPADDRRPGEPLEDYLARSRKEALGATRKRLLAAGPPKGLAEAHRLLLALLDNAVKADEALARQVAAYQCGNFGESVAHSSRLHELVTETARLDRDLIRELASLEERGLLAAAGLEGMGREAG
jgi:hypothetical protein